VEGLVICSTGKLCDVYSDGNIFKCTLKGNLRLKGIKTTNPISVGDRVLFELEDKSTTGRIFKILDRKNVIIRRATNLSRQTHILAANIDLAVLVVTPVLPRTSTGFIDRFLITAEAYNIPVLLVFNKMDLFENDIDLVKYYNQLYINAGYKTLMVSATNKTNIEEFREIISNKVILLTGHSGVGKSTLIKAIDPNIKIKIGNLSETHLKGKHTTTFARMYLLQNETFIIDTPGIKEFGVVDFEPWELGHWFREFKEFIPKCHYANCTHQHEPDCAVRMAVESGKIDEERYSNYIGILNNISE
jgi:ribosome biogenesis GTPase